MTYGSSLTAIDRFAGFPKRYDAGVLAIAGDFRTSSASVLSKLRRSLHTVTETLNTHNRHTIWHSLECSCCFSVPRWQCLTLPDPSPMMGLSIPRQIGAGFFLCSPGCSATLGNHNLLRHFQMLTTETSSISDSAR